MVKSRHQNVGQNHNLMTANKSLEDVGKVQTFGNESNDQSCRLNSGNACYILFSIFLYFRLFSKNLKYTRLQFYSFCMGVKRGLLH